MDVKTNQELKLLGRHIVAVPEICHGQPTFRGTRIFVADVLEQVASGMAWEAIINMMKIDGRWWIVHKMSYGVHKKN